MKKVNKTSKEKEIKTIIKIYQKVLMPIEVPTGEYCWKETVCPNFDNEGGWPSCRYDLGDLKYNSKNGSVRKPKRCLDLKNSE